MNILFHLHAYPDDCLAGAEMMAHRIAKFLQTKGHKIRVLSGNAKQKRKFFENVDVFKFEHGKDSEHWIWSDLVITHLGNTNHCYNVQRYYRKKIVHLIHNSFEVMITRAKVTNNYLIYNSEYVKNVLKYPIESVVCIPPVDYREYEKVDNSNGKYFTLVNLNENKGGKLFIEIAQKMPHIQFLGIEGGYYEQNKVKLPNVTYWKPQHDMKKVYEQSKVVMMLSDYESWGQVAIESISSGVPVLSTKAEGLSRALDYAGTFIDRDIDSICEGIEKLQDKEYYTIQKTLARKRAEELDPIKYLENLNSFLLKIEQKTFLS